MFNSIYVLLGIKKSKTAVNRRLSRPVFALTPKCRVLYIEEAANTNFKVFGLIRPGIKPTIKIICRQIV